MATYSKTNFKKQIVIDSDHSPKLVKRSGVNLEEFAFTLHIPFEQINSWHNVKRTTIDDCTYLQILSTNICSQLEHINACLTPCSILMRFTADETLAQCREFLVMSCC